MHLIRDQPVYIFSLFTFANATNFALKVDNKLNELESTFKISFH